MTKNNCVPGQIDLFATEDQVAVCLVAQEASSGIRDVLPSHLLKDPYDRCQPFELGESLGHLVSAGDLVSGGVCSSNQHLPNSDLVVSAWLDHPVQIELDSSMLMKCINHQ